MPQSPQPIPADQPSQPLLEGRPEERKRSRRLVLWSVGLCVSLSLAIIPPLVNPKAQSVQIGILIGVVAIGVGLLVEQNLRSDQLATEVRTELKVNADLTADGLHDISTIITASLECREHVAQVISMWSAIDDHRNFHTFQKIRRARGQEFLNCLTELASGAITVNVDGPFSARMRSFSDVASYRAISVGPLGFWRGTFGRNYLRAQAASIRDDGLAVERIFVLEDNERATAEPIVRAQVAAGIKVWVVRRSQMESIYQQHAIEQGVLHFKDGSKLLMQPIARGAGQQADRERLSVISAEIAEAEFSLTLLKSHSTIIHSNTEWPFE